MALLIVSPASPDWRVHSRGGGDHMWYLQFFCTSCTPDADTRAPQGCFEVGESTPYTLSLGAVSRWEDRLHTTEENDTTLDTPNA